MGSGDHFPLPPSTRSFFYHPRYSRKGIICFIVLEAFVKLTQEPQVQLTSLSSTVYNLCIRNAEHLLPIQAALNRQRAQNKSKRNDAASQVQRILDKQTNHVQPGQNPSNICCAIKCFYRSTKLLRAMKVSHLLYHMHPYPRFKATGTSKK